LTFVACKGLAGHGSDGKERRSRRGLARYGAAWYGGQGTARLGRSRLGVPTTAFTNAVRL
jgi:hypothetical protein